MSRPRIPVAPPTKVFGGKRAGKRKAIEEEMQEIRLANGSTITFAPNGGDEWQSTIPASDILHDIMNEEDDGL